MSKSDPVRRFRNAAFEKAAPRLAELAERARTLGRRMLTDVLELGEVLLEARGLIAHGHWLKWLDDLGLSEDMARHFMDVSEMSKSRKLRDFGQQTPLSALYILARKSTSEETRDAVFARCEAGEKVSLAEVQATVMGEVHVKTTYTDHGIVSPAGAVTTGEQRLEREEAASKQKLEDKVASLMSSIHAPMPRGSELVQMKVRWDLVPVHHYIDLMTVNAANRLTGNGPLTAFEQIIRLLPVLTDNEWRELARIIHERGA
jgi:Protein of unknown function (DUF3102)